MWNLARTFDINRDSRIIFSSVIALIIYCYVTTIWPLRSKLYAGIREDVSYACITHVNGDDALDIIS